MSPEQIDPEVLRHFPSYALRKGSVLYRAHHRDGYPLQFSSGSTLRFDVDAAGGTLYASRDVETAMDAVLGRASAGLRIVTTAQADLLKVSKIVVLKPRKLASFIAPRAKNFDTTKQMLGVKRALPWARALHAAGFEGVLYSSKYTEGARGGRIALFGTKTPKEKWPSPDPEPIPGRQAVQEAGWELVPILPKSHLHIV
jgi:hypothetical protein